MDEKKKSSGFPLDDLLEEAGGMEMEQEDWEKAREERQQKQAKLLAKAIFAGDMSSEASIAETICKFNKLADFMKGY